MRWSTTTYTIASAVWAVIFLANLPSIDGILRRCYRCRSRGDLGDCKDPFTYNVTQLSDPSRKIYGVQAVPCASGWCGKVIEGGGSRNDDYDMATERMCVQRGPSDSEDRCADTIYNYRKVYMCFCQGDLCNAATTSTSWTQSQLAMALGLGAMAVVWTKWTTLMTER